MADLFEFTTWPKHQNLFYKVTSNGLTFSLKTTERGAVGLSEKPCRECDYWIVIERSRVKLIKGRQVSLILVPNILPDGEFWILWKNNEIRFGKDNQTHASWPGQDRLQSIQYVTFSLGNEGSRQSAEWKFYLPPAIENIPLKKFEGGEPQWMEADNQLPNGALIGGHESEFLYIMRAKHRGSLTPGKFVPSMGLGFLAWGGGSHEKNEFEILCGYNCAWVKTKGNHIPVGAVEGGYSEDQHETLYIGRVNQNGHIIPGKVQPSHNCCYIPYIDKEIGHREYEILVVPNLRNTSVSRYHFKTVLHENQYDDGDDGDDGDDDDDFAYEGVEGDDLYFA